MDKAAVLVALREIGLVPVLRAESVDKAMALASAIADGGVTVLEITMTVPGAIQVMRKLAEQRPDILIGAGTVLDAETARMCLLEGAQFVVSPALNLKTIEMCHRVLGGRTAGRIDPDRDCDRVGGRSRCCEGVSGQCIGWRKVSHRPQGTASAH